MHYCFRQVMGVVLLILPRLLASIQITLINTLADHSYILLYSYVIITVHILSSFMFIGDTRMTSHMQVSYDKTVNMLEDLGQYLPPLPLATI